MRPPNRCRAVCAGPVAPLVGLLLAAAAAPLRAQQPDVGAGAAANVGDGLDGWTSTASGHRLRVVPIDTAGQALAVLWPHEPCPDPDAERALATAQAMWRARSANGVLPAGTTTGVDVGRTHTVHTVVLPTASADGAAAWLRALTSAPDLEVGRDAAEQVLARAALLADDASWLYPGEVLLGRARRALAAGTEAGTETLGSPRSLQQLAVADFARALAAPPRGPLRAVVLGSGTGVDGFVRQLDALAPAAATAPVARLPVEAAAGGDYGQAAFTPHERVDAAYVATALPAPPAGPDTLAFALAVEVVQTRTRALFVSYRGAEPLARAPFVSYDFLLGDPLVLLCRRAPSGEGPERPQRELQNLLVELRRPLTPSETALAARMLVAQWAPPPWDGRLLRTLRELPASLGPRARALCLLGHRGIPDAMVRSLAEIDAEAVGESLRAALPASPWWGGLVPTTTKPAGW